MKKRKKSAAANPQTKPEQAADEPSGFELSAGRKETLLSCARELVERQNRNMSLFACPGKPDLQVFGPEYRGGPFIVHDELEEQRGIRKAIENLSDGPMTSEQRNDGLRAIVKHLEPCRDEWAQQAAQIGVSLNDYSRWRHDIASCQGVQQYLNVRAMMRTEAEDKALLAKYPERWQRAHIDQEQYWREFKKREISAAKFADDLWLKKLLDDLAGDHLNRAECLVFLTLRYPDHAEAFFDFRFPEIETLEAAKGKQEESEQKATGVDESGASQAGPARESKRGKRLGRKPLSPKEAKKRRDTVEAWNKARDSGVSRADFCHDRLVDVAYLETCLDWSRKQTNSTT